MWKKYLKIPDFLSISRRDVEKILLALPLKKNAKVLDIGCGYARISLFLKQQGFDVMAIDIEDKMVKEALKKGIPAKKWMQEISNSLQIHLILVITDGLLEHFKNPEKILKEEYKVSKKFVVNFLPKTTWWNKILEKFQNTPEVYWRNKEYWKNIHQRFFKKVMLVELKRIWAVICEK